MGTPDSSSTATRTSPPAPQSTFSSRLFPAQRSGGVAASGYDGDLGELHDIMSKQFDPDQTWSASRLESYRTCPFYFYVGSVLGLEPRELMRKKEKEYKEKGLANPDLSRDALIAAMVSHPKLIERPIVVKDGRAALGRPPESVLDIL